MLLKELQNTYKSPGRVDTLIIRNARLEAVSVIKRAEALKDIGLKGDHYKNPGGNRQVTLIQAEHLEVIASLLGVRRIPPELTRRNIVVSGINLLSLKGNRFKVGEAVLEYSGECHPCSRMERIWDMADIML